MGLRIPSLSERIQIWGLTLHPDVMGGYSEQWTLHSSCWSQVQWLSSEGTNGGRSRLVDDLAPHERAGRYKFVIQSQPLPQPLRIAWQKRFWGLSSDIVALNAHFCFFIGHDLHQAPPPPDLK